MATIAKRRKISLGFTMLGFCIPLILSVYSSMTQIITLIRYFGFDWGTSAPDFFSELLRISLYLMPISTLCWIIAVLLSPDIQVRRGLLTLTLLGGLTSVAFWGFIWVYSQTR